MKQIKLIANTLLGIVFCLAGTSCQTDVVSTPTLTSSNEALPVGSTRTTESLPFIKGADLSYTNELEDCGVQFTENGVAKTSYELMNSYGANLVRLRLWHNPTWTKYSTLSDVKKSIKRAKDLGMYVLLDFHYSDTWTDPEQNVVPAAWASVVNNTTVLSDSVYNYTLSTLQTLLSKIYCQTWCR